MSARSSPTSLLVDDAIAKPTTEPERADMTIGNADRDRTLSLHSWETVQTTRCWCQGDVRLVDGRKKESGV